MRTIDADICIVGSGAGGALMAWQAAKRGLKTVVLERGPYMRASDMSTAESQMIPRLYKDGGMQMSTSMDLFIMQGSCVGGSTVISNMVLMRPEPKVFSRWRGLGADVRDDVMTDAFDQIEALLGATRREAKDLSETSRLFERGAKSLGYAPERMMKALGSCRACGNCNIGCTFDTKRSALATFVPWAEELGAQVIADTEVTRVRTKRGVVEGVEATCGSRREELFVRAKKVVVAGGAIGSSALLLRSGIGKNVGTRLAFNAGAMVVAELDRPVDAFDADQMTIFLKHDEYLIEATHNPILSTALITPGWMEEHGLLMRRAKHLAYAGAMVGTEPNGRVVMSPFFGHEETRFRASERDMARLRKGVKTIARIFLAAGAKRVLLPFEEPTYVATEADLAVVDEKMRRLRDFQCGTSHPQGGNPMSDDRDVGVVGSNLEVHGVRGLFVCDASVFPDGVEVNPMLSVMAVAMAKSPEILAS